MQMAADGDAEADDAVVAVADFQSAGRGMGTNTWESEPGKNLLFSILLHPTFIPPRWQYLLSVAEALAVRSVLAEVIGDDNVTVKWPNDIYWNDMKLSGTRIDLNISSSGIRDLVIGTGINVNQREFKSDAPNPVSLWQITGMEHDRDAIMECIAERFAEYYERLRMEADSEHSELMAEYHAHLYRRSGLHRFEDADGSFMAEIAGVGKDGIMTLRRGDGVLKAYEFKEVKFII